MIKELNNIIENKKINIVLQPIVSLKNGNTFGYEALSRTCSDSSIQNPEILFSYAKQNKRLWDLESLCRIKTLEKYKELNLSEFLFLNVDPLIINDKSFIEGFTKEYLINHNISPELIIFEITERTAIDDYCSFNKVIINYKNQGYRIALDDVGAGYSGLKTLSKTKPHFVKIDMDLIRNIHKDSIKSALIKSLVSFCNSTNMKTIAEGIETKEELYHLIKLGVDYGQGYFIQKPSPNIHCIKENIQLYIKKCNNVDVLDHNKRKLYIGELSENIKVFESKTLCKEIQEYLVMTETKGVTIIENKLPVGLVMKSTLDSKLAMKYGYSVFSERPISLLMDKRPLIVDFYSDINEVAQLAMERSSNHIYDCVIVTKDNYYCGLVTIKNLLLYKTEVERSIAKELNPLTGLPGNNLIENHLNKLILSNVKHAVLYIDIDNFKSFNDTYGFEIGDDIIIFTATAIQNKLNELFIDTQFSGHIGGDDFIVIFPYEIEKVNNFCESLITYFDTSIVNFFTNEDIANKYYKSTNRNGDLIKMPLTTISISVLCGFFSNYINAQEISQEMSHIKKEVKKVKKSAYIIKNM
ncbi:EAL domain-containing protein [Clostridium sp. DL1XJH146]